MQVEVEIRSFVDEKQFDSLLKDFNKQNKPVYEDNQITYYFSGSYDLRLQKNDEFAKVWLKKGSMHDVVRPEIEVMLDKDDAQKMLDILKVVGFDVQIKWLRKRICFEKDDIFIYFDDTKGYGKIIELEKHVDDSKADETHEMLKRKMNELGLKLTPKEEFNKKFEHYKSNWKTLLGED